MNLMQALVGVALLSALINLLYLTGSFYMLQVYDRIIPSRSLETLVARSILADIRFAGQGALDLYRTCILSRMGRSIDEMFSPKLFAIVSRLPLVGHVAMGQQRIRDLDSVRGFFANGGPSAFLDLPWTPAYIALCFPIHPLIGLAHCSAWYCWPAHWIGGMADAPPFERGYQPRCAAQ